MKNFLWRRFVQSNQGSVSVYLIVIIVPIFLFHAIMIDYARVKLAERESEMAVKSGLRSVMSGFDTDLQSYGLYGLNDVAGKANPLFGEMIAQNLTPENPGKYLHLLDERLNDQTNSLKSIYTLANQTVFHQQILEEMKYKAPIEYTLELINKFKKQDLPSQLNASKQFTENADKLESLLDLRNQALDDAWSSSTQFLRDTETQALSYMDQVNSISGFEESKRVREIEKILLNLTSNYQDLTEIHSSIIIELNEAEAKNTLLNNEKQRLIAASGASMTNEEIFKAIIIYDINYFTLYRTEISKTLALFSGLMTLLDGYLASLNNLNAIPNLPDLWMQASNVLVQQTQAFKQVQEVKESQRQQAENQKKLNKNEQKSKLNQALTSAKGIKEGCSILSEDAYSQLYVKLKGTSDGSTPGLYAKYQSYNKNANEILVNDHPYKLGSGEETNQSTLNWIQRFSGVVGEFRDVMFLNEYVLNKFSYRTVQMTNQSFQLDSPKINHSLKNQEVEYILYGLSSCSANYAAAYSEMYVMLLAVRTMEALLKPQNELLNFGSPLLFFLAAAAQGAIEALNDMNKLLKGESIPILQKTPNITVDYKQLLRIFLLFHSNEEKMMSRMQALIELETNTSLENKATYIQGSAVISLRLWFIPSFFKSLDLIGLSSCKTVKNRCEIKKTAVMAY